MCWRVTRLTSGSDNAEMRSGDKAVTEAGAETEREGRLRAKSTMLASVTFRKTWNKNILSTQQMVLLRTRILGILCGWQWR